MGSGMVVGDQLSVVSGDGSATATFIAPANANAAGFGIKAAGVPTGGTLYGVTIVEVFTGEILAEALEVPVGQGKLLRVGLTPACTVSGIKVTLTLVDGTFTSSEVVGQIGWYLGPAVAAVVNSADEPLYTEGPLAAATAQAGGLEVQVDQLVAGQWAAQVTDGGATYPAHPDMAVMGHLGNDGKSVQTAPDPPQHCWAYSATSPAASFIAGVAGKSIRLRKAQLQFTASGAFDVAVQSSSTSVTVINTFPQSTITNESAMFCDWDGFPLPAGEGLSLEGTSNVRMSGYITYDLY